MKSPEKCPPWYVCVWTPSMPSWRQNEREKERVCVGEHGVQLLTGTVHVSKNRGWQCSSCSSSSSSSSSLSTTLASPSIQFLGALSTSFLSPFLQHVFCFSAFCSNAMWKCSPFILSSCMDPLLFALLLLRRRRRLRAVSLMLSSSPSDSKTKLLFGKRNYFQQSLLTCVMGLLPMQEK